MSDRQTLMIDTPAGTKPIKAPAGWQFDKTAVIAWAWLLTHTRESHKKQRLRRHEYQLEAQMEALSIVLASALGMAAYYWREQARDFVREEDNGSETRHRAERPTTSPASARA